MYFNISFNYISFANMTETNYITKEIKDLGICSKIYNTKHLSGGCINQTSCYETDKGNLFVKVHKIYPNYHSINTHT